MKYILILFLLVITGCDEKLYNQNYGVDVENLQAKCSESFDEAEKEILKDKVIPEPDDGTDPDPKKCICGGTGVIIQGDGHRSVCPYHGTEQSGVNK